MATEREKLRLPLRSNPLAGIAEDLWGWAEENTPEAPVRKVYKPTFPPFEELWRVADETVDWTEALVREHPADGLTSENLWQFFHQHAQAVLAGEVSAYLAVMKTANPLGDLKPYARSFSVGAVDADMLRCVFQAEPHYMQETHGEKQRYLCGVALRAARDLMALLPVQRVQVEARQEDTLLLSVVYDRETLQGVRFGFADPAAITAACGGILESMT